MKKGPSYKELEHRVRALEKEAHEKDRLLQALNCVRDSVVVLDLDGFVTYWSNGAERQLGYASDDAMGRHISFLYREDEQEFLEKQVLAPVREKGTHEVNVRVRGKSGEEINRDLSLALLRDDNGKMCGFISHGRDVSDLRHAESEASRQGLILEAINRVLRKTLTCKTNEEVVRTCLSVAEDLTGSRLGFICQVGPQGRFRDAAMSDAGWKRCSIKGKEMADRIRQMKVRGYAGRALREGRPMIVNDPDSHPERVGTPEGHPGITSFLLVPLKRGQNAFGAICLANKQGGYTQADQEAVEALSISFTEALDRKQAEVTLRESEIKFRALAESTSSGIIIYQGEKFIYVNPAWTAQTGYTLEDSISMNYWDVVHPEMRGLIREQGQSRQRGEDVPERYEARVLLKGGGTKWMLCAATRINYEGRPSIMAVGLDITERKRAEEILHEKEKQLESQARQLKELNTALKVLLEHQEEEKNLLKRIFWPIQEGLSFHMWKRWKRPGWTRNAGYIWVLSSPTSGTWSPRSSIPCRPDTSPSLPLRSVLRLS